jgi:hypothetical protein
LFFAAAHHFSDKAPLQASIVCIDEMLCFVGHSSTIMTQTSAGSRAAPLVVSLEKWGSAFD